MLGSQEGGAEPSSHLTLACRKGLAEEAGGGAWRGGGKREEVGKQETEEETLMVEFTAGGKTSPKPLLLPRRTQLGEGTHPSSPSSCQHWMGSSHSTLIVRS